LQEGKQNTPEAVVGKRTPNIEQKRYPALKQKLRMSRNTKGENGTPFAMISVGRRELLGK